MLYVNSLFVQRKPNGTHILGEGHAFSIELPAEKKTPCNCIVYVCMRIVHLVFRAKTLGL